MNSKNENNFFRRLKIQMCELLQVLQKQLLKGALKNKCSWNSKTH